MAPALRSSFFEIVRPEYKKSPNGKKSKDYYKKSQLYRCARIILPESLSFSFIFPSPLLLLTNKRRERGAIFLYLHLLVSLLTSRSQRYKIKYSKVNQTYFRVVSGTSYRQYQVLEYTTFSFSLIYTSVPLSLSFSLYIP